ncbi:MAG: AAA family ATPase [Prochlorotrichaceae cyanobacterium]
MHLSRVQVPDFRVLKAIDIAFEPDYIPRIFPLGSLNGGGKSTLLQLIFTLLHCAGDSEKHRYIQNLLYGYALLPAPTSRTVARFWLKDQGQTHEIEFSVYDNHGIRLLLEQNLEPESEPEILQQNQEIDYCFSAVNYNYCSPAEKIMSDAVEDYLIQHHLYYVTDYHLEEKPYIVRSFEVESETIEEEYGQGVLLVKIPGLTSKETGLFLETLSPNLFLAAPSTQVFLFSSPESRRKLLRDTVYSEYENDFCQIEKELTHFFPYRFLSVNLLITLFRIARDKDFNKVIRSQGADLEHSHVKQLLTELSAILGKGILVKPNEDLSGAVFELQENDRLIKLQPEDLSHGELKRLSIFMWLKYYQMTNAIVLMDEPEIAFHPDWQYQIVQDLLDWAPDNQYILATHSYEVCQALTPAHVKELEIAPLLGICPPPPFTSGNEGFA